MVYMSPWEGHNRSQKKKSCCIICTWLEFLSRCGTLISLPETKARRRATDGHCGGNLTTPCISAADASKAHSFEPTRFWAPNCWPDANLFCYFHDYNYSPLFCSCLGCLLFRNSPQLDLQAVIKKDKVECLTFL